MTTKIQATQALPAQELPDQEPSNQEKNIPTNNRDGLLNLRALLFQKNIGDKEAMKASCGQLVQNKGIDLNMPICFMTLLEEAILRRFEDAAEILIELSDEMKIPLGRKDGLGKKDGPSLLHIATYSPKTMRDALELREKCEMVKKDTEVSDLYKQTKRDHPSIPMHRQAL
jgi:hypothetical protein